MATIGLVIVVGLFIIALIVDSNRTTKHYNEEMSKRKEMETEIVNELLHLRSENKTLKTQRRKYYKVR